MKRVVLMLAVVLIAFFGCKKPMPEITGEWETVTSVGFKWIYQFSDDGSACQKVPEYFDARFCYDYAVKTKTGTTVEFTVQKREPENWVWSWVDDDGDIADVTVTVSNGEKQRFILKRLK